MVVAYRIIKQLRKVITTVMNKVSVSTTNDASFADAKRYANGKTA